MKNFDELKNSLLYFHVSELKTLCKQLDLPVGGEKIMLVDRIVSYVINKKVIQPTKFPIKVCAKKGTIYGLTDQSLILYGNYKNDLKTRIFMKKLVGEHFHFTAYGIDWIKKRWASGNTPTYKQFALFWQNEYLKRKEQPASPKPEWAYINFVQSYLAKKPKSSRQELMIAWEQERQDKVKNAKLYFKMLAN